jgi:NTP pyrophosphatase (non-canonical NTP hydrolase)
MLSLLLAGDNMDFSEYQTSAKRTAIYPGRLDGRVYYPALGLAGEVGELLNKIKKQARDGKVLDKNEIAGELGDVLWYVSQIAEELGLRLEDVAAHNIEKLRSRDERGVINGSGDER